MDKLPNTSSESDVTILSDKQLLKSIYVATLLAFLLPPFIGGSLMGIVGFYPMPEFYLVFLNYTGAYVFIVLALVLTQIPRWHHNIVELTRMDRDLALERATQTFTRLPGYLLASVTLYSIFGAISADLSLEQMGIREYTLRDHLYSQFGIIPVVLITSFPIFFYFTDRLGLYLGPRNINVKAIPLWVKLFMLGIVTPLLIDSLLLGYYYNRTGYFELETLILWLSLLALAAGGTWLAWRSLCQSISPLETFIASQSNTNEIPDNYKLLPLSLDELGMLTAKFDKLLTSEKELSANLKHERDFATNLMNTTPMIVLLFDLRGYIQYANPYFEQLSGYQLSEIKDKEWFATFLPAQDQDHIRELFLKATHESPTQGNINPIIVRNGDKREIEWYDQCTRDTGGKITGLLAVGLDVTQRIAAEIELAKHRNNLEELIEDRTKELRKTQNELVRKERLATLGQLTATVSHELRNPLGAMKPSLFIINKYHDKDNEHVHHAIERLDRNIDRCDRIIDELLNFTRITELDTQSTCIDEWLELVIDEQDIPAGIRIEKDFFLNDTELAIDTNRLRRAIINVVDNACHAMLNAEQTGVEKGSCLCIKSGANQKRIEIAISDNGTGIPADVLQNVFEPLFSTKGFGVGLGMPTVKQIMEQHNGGIEINTTEGEGTTLTLWLPSK